MSNESKRSKRRPYELKARARRKEEVHRRITEAAVYLHETIGPAKTTMEGIAKRAGVQRATVYNHFPSELELYEACSSHWFKENPPPDRSNWAAIEDPNLKVQAALEALYRYYRGGEQMLANVLKDAPSVPAMDAIRKQSWEPMLRAIVGELVSAWSSGTDSDADVALRDRLFATLLIAVDFFNWQHLSRSGLTDTESASLAACWVRSTALAKN